MGHQQLPLKLSTPSTNSNIITPEPLSQTAMLVTLNISMPGITAKDDNATRAAHSVYGIGFASGHYQKNKYAKVYINPVQSVMQQARAYHRNMTMPWHGLNRLLPSKLYFEYTQEMNNHKLEFGNKRDDFIAKWPDIIAEAQNRLKTLYRPGDYPSAGSLKAYFSFDLEINPIPKGEHLDLKDLVTDELDILKGEIEKANDRHFKSATQDLWFRLFEVVEAMHKKVSNPDAKRFHKTIVTNIEDLVKLLDSLNVSKDPQLIEMTEEIATKLCTYDVNDIKKSKHVRADLANETDEILDKMSAYTGIKPDKGAHATT